MTKTKSRGPIGQDLVDFIIEKGRFPFITDDRKPWTYRGFLLLYVQEIHRAHPMVPDRWGYLAATVEQGKLLDKPIPKIAFEGIGSSGLGQVSSNIKSCVAHLERHGFWSSFRIFVDWLGWALGLDDEPPREVTEEEHEALYREVNLEPWLITPSDHLGHYLCEQRGKGWNPNAFYPTPHNVVQAMVEMTFHDINQEAARKNVDPRAMSVNDPCLGTGRMLLHASNYSMNLSGQDVDPFVLKIALINGLLFAPWMIYKPSDKILNEPEFAGWQSRLF